MAIARMLHDDQNPPSRALIRGFQRKQGPDQLTCCCCPTEGRGDSQGETMKWKRFGWLLAATLPACGNGGDDPAPAFGLTNRVVVQGLTFPTDSQPPGTFQLVDAFPNLWFNDPVVLTHAGDGTDRLFVAELGGRIRVFNNDSGTMTTSLFLDLRPVVQTGGEAGLLGLAFDPDYTTNGFFYVRYETPTATPGANHRSVVSRFQVFAGNPNLADAGSETVLLSFDNPYSNHNGGGLAFGMDGMLYVSIGDGGSQNDPNDLAQNLNSIFGKVLRIQSDGSIPADNPFVGAGGGVREEIWAYGFRNPWRFSFDRSNGNLWLGDVGQDSREEVDLVVAGGDYGWDTFEGTLDHENPGGTPISTTVEPVYEYDHSLGFSITGGYVYRGTASPSIIGDYLYADFVTGRVWALVWDGSQAVFNEQILTVTNPSAFGEDEAGEVYICSFDGRIYGLLETGGGGGPPPFPQLLSETGLFTDTAELTPTPGLIEYGVRTPLWSDGALKRRWMALPGIAQVTFDPTQAWEFPVDTVLVKHFEIETSPGQVRRLETRVLINEAAGWQGYTYKWNVLQDDANLLPGADSEVLTIFDGEGGSYQFTWDFPDRADCLVCHTFASGRVLGIRARQLNGGFAYPAMTDNQLRAWNHIGLFTANIGAHSQYGSLPRWGNPTAGTRDLARAYLAVNCAHCHLPGGPTTSSMDMRYGVPTPSMGVVNVDPASGDLGLPNPYLVWPGIKESSVLWERMRVQGTNRMPPIGSNLVHQDGVDVVGQWIDDGAD